MANRAYLYFCDDVSAIRFEDHYKKRDGNERDYLDSRHHFPLAWFLFFDSRSVLLIQELDLPWREIYLAREWDAAIADFARRVPLLQSWFPTLRSSDVDTFLGWVKSLQTEPSERFLVVDPSELEIEDVHAPQIEAALAALDNPALNVQQKYAHIDYWSYPNPPSEPEALRSHLFG